MHIKGIHVIGASGDLDMDNIAGILIMMALILNRNGWTE